MKKHILIFVIALLGVGVKAQNKIKSYEYWFDSDFASVVTTSITPSPSVNLSAAISTNSLSVGLHTINMRFKDDSSRYSSVLSSFFMKLEASSGSAHKMATYEFWFDSNYASKTTGTLTSSPSINLTQAIATNSLTEGLHTFHIRFKDNVGLWSSTISQFFIKQSATTSPTAKMSSFEYWYDNNYSSRVTTAMLGKANEQVLKDLNASSLTNGLHTINIRFKDVNGKWSSTLSQFFMKLGPSSSNPGAVMKQYEYWFDSNYAGKVTTAMGSTANEKVLSGLSTSTLTPGLHTINIRFKDNSGKWSSTLSQFFMKQTITASSSPALVQYEYWFDSGYANKMSIAMSGNQSESVIAGLSTSTITQGLHTFNIRFKDANGKWSSTVSQFFFKPGNQTLMANNLITAYRYWFDTSNTKTVNIKLPGPVNPLSLVTSIDMTKIRKGKHEIHFQFKDTLGLWSSVTTDTITKKSLPIAQFSSTNTVVCDSGIVTFNNESIDGDIYNWNFGDGASSSDSLGVHKYTLPGVYSVTLTITDTTTKVSNTITLANYIRVAAHPTVNLGNDTSICTGSSITLTAGTLGYTYKWNNNSTANTLVTNNAGTYSVVVTNTYGCKGNDAIQIGLNSLPIVNLGNDVTICQGSSVVLNGNNPGAKYKWSTGATTQTISASAAANYILQVTNNNGCIKSDTVKVALKTSPTVNLGNDLSICQGASQVLNANNAGAKFTWSNGATTQSITATLQGNYWVEVTNNNNCSKRDTIALTVNVNPVVNLGSDVTVCQGTQVLLDAGNAGASYSWSTGATTKTITISTAGNYRIQVTNNFGCIKKDTIAISLKNAPTVNLGADATICHGVSKSLNAGNAGAIYSWSTGATTQAITATSQSVYWVQVTNANNCSKRDTLALIVNANPVVHLGNDTSICQATTITLDAGGLSCTYLWSTGSTAKTLSVNTAGTYTVAVTNSQNCKTKDTIKIGVLPTVSSQFTHTIQSLKITVVNQSTNATSYDWDFGDGNHDNTFEPNHTYTLPGNYDLCLAATNSCGTKSTCANISVVTNALAQAVNDEFVYIFPNPTSGLLNLHTSLATQVNLHLIIYDNLGKEILNKVFEETAANTFILDLSEMADGIYFLHLVDENNKTILVRKIVLMH